MTISKSYFLVRFLSVLTLLACVATKSHSNELEHIARDVTVKIEVRGKVKGAFEDSKPSFLEGTGFIVSRDGYVITNRHVIYPEHSKYIEAPDITVYIPNSNGIIGEGYSRTATLVHTDEEYDFQLLKIDGSYQAAKCEYTTPAIGDEVYVFGYGGGLSGDYTSAVGVIQPSQNISGVTGKLLADLDSKYGNSGSPVFSVESNSIIGYVLQSTQVPEEANFDVTVFHRLLQVRELLPDSANCKFASNSCLTINKLDRHSKMHAQGGLMENCTGNVIVEANRIRVNVATLDGTNCTQAVVAQVSVNAPQYPDGRQMKAKVTTKYRGAGYFEWNYRPPENNYVDKIRPTPEQKDELHNSKFLTMEGEFRNGRIYEFKVGAIASKDREPVGSAEFIVDVVCE